MSPGALNSFSNATHCFKYSLLRALLLGSRPGGGFPRAAAEVPAEGPLAQFEPPHDVGLPEVPTDGAPLGRRVSGNGESSIDP